MAVPLLLKLHMNFMLSETFSWWAELDWDKKIGPGIFGPDSPSQLVGHNPPVYHPCGPLKYVYLLYYYPSQSWVVSA